MSKQKTAKIDDALCPTNEEMLAYGTFDVVQMSKAAPNSDSPFNLNNPQRIL
jgi:hypothetical protein